MPKPKEYKIKKADLDAEKQLPVRKTKEIAETHEKNKTVRPRGRDNPPHPEGKELFDFVLKGMSKPDNP